MILRLYYASDYMNRPRNCHSTNRKATQKHSFLARHHAQESFSTLAVTITALLRLVRVTPSKVIPTLSTHNHGTHRRRTIALLPATSQASCLAMGHQEIVECTYHPASSVAIPVAQACRSFHRSWLVHRSSDGTIETDNVWQCLSKD